MIDVGVASPMAQGHAMMSTATALTNANVSAGEGPHQEGKQCRQHDRRDEPQRDLVDHGLNRKLGPLGLLDHPNNLGQHGVGSYSRRPECQGTLLIDSSANHLASWCFLDRNGFTGNHGFIDKAAAFDDGSIYRHPLSGTYLDDVADDHIADRDVDRATVSLNMRDLGLQADQPFDGLRGTAFCPGFEIPSHQDQRNDDSGSLVIHIHGTRWKKARRKGGNNRIAEGSQGAYRH